MPENLVERIPGDGLEDLEWEQSLLPLGLDKYWISRFLNRHSHLTSRFSVQVKKQRIVNHNPEILKQALDV